MRQVRAVLVGDPQVGKSSIIKCYITNNFDDNIAAVIPVAVLPPEASPEGVPLTLVDTSSKDAEMLEDEVRRADVAVVVYAADRPDTLARVGSYWLPRLRDLKGDMPVIVVGNKLDLRSGDAHVIESELRSAAGPIMEIFRQVETLMDCSARKMINVSELMLFATKAVLHPTAPLYDTGSHEMKTACVRALTRVFGLCDGNQDGVLDDVELNKFQREVFGSPLVATQITGIKNMLRRNVPDGVTDAGISVSGFLYLHKLFIQRGRSETTWEVLRAHHYGSNLRLLPERLPSLSNLAPDQICQLPSDVISFLSNLFWQHDLEGNGALTPTQLKALFVEKTPGLLWEGKDWHSRIDSNGHLDVHGFISLWAAACHLDTLECIEYLVYLGYGGGNLATADAAIKKCPSRRADYKRRVTSRSVFEVLVCCAPEINAAEVALGLVGREREAGKEGVGSGGAGKGQVSSAGGMLVVGKVHSSRGAGGTVGGGKASRRDDAITGAVHLIVRAVSLEVYPSPSPLLPLHITQPAHPPSTPPIPPPPSFQPCPSSRPISSSSSLDFWRFPRTKHLHDSTDAMWNFTGGAAYAARSKGA